MIDKSSNNAEVGRERNLLGWLLFPISLFPLVALMTYDWRSIEELNCPALPSTNWIGALGDAFAYNGYILIGLAIWIIPVVCVILAICLTIGKKVGNLRRLLWSAVLLISSACLLQVAQSHAPGIAATLEKINLANAGGVSGYLLMTRLLSPLLSDFGASVLMIILLVISLVATVGIKNIVDFFTFLYRWAMVGNYMKKAESPDAGSADDDYKAQQAAYLAALQAKQDAKAAKLAAKAAAKAEREAEREAAREAARAAKEAALAEKIAARKAAGAPPPVSPAPAPAKSAAAAAPEESAEIDDKGPYILPSVSLLDPLKKSSADHSDVGEMSQKLVDTLKLFGVDAEISYTVQGPVVTKYAVQLAPGTRYSTVTNIADNLKGALHAKSLRIEAPIPGEEAVGIEVPNRSPAGISFREIIESNEWKNFKGELPLLFGRDAAGRELIADLASMPHMLVAGATGQGKSVCLNSIINGLLMTKTPDQLKLIMVDPKSVEFTAYSSIPHLIVPIITDNKKVVFSLRWAVTEMEKRLKMFARARVKNIYDFNRRPSFTQTDMFGNDSEVGSDMPRTVPYIVIIIDEVADLMMAASKEVTPDISRLTAKARAAGIHLILATQRPDAKIITGTIKANIPGRVAFKTATSIDSRTILDDTGAENLIGRGDMLFKTKEALLIRAQGAWISETEIANITSFIEQHSNTDFDERFTNKLSTIKEAEVDIFASDDETAEEQGGGRQPAAGAGVKSDEGDDLLKRAVEVIINTNRASISHFQRRLGIGYNNAAKLCDRLEEEGIIGPQHGAGPRPIIMDQQQLLAVFNGNGGAGENAEAGGEAAAEAESADDTGDLFTQEDNT